jgi:hypothetical protein
MILGVTDVTVVDFKVAVPLLIRLVVGTPGRMGRVLAGVSKELLEKSAAGMKLISETQPSWVGPTSVGFATSARAKCAFIVLQ